MNNQEQINRIINNLTQKINSSEKNQVPNENQVNDLLKGLNEAQKSKLHNIL